MDARALAEVYERYSPLIFRFAVRQLADADLAEDCVAETFSRLLKALSDGWGPRDHVRAYLYRSAHNWIVDSYRRQKPDPLEYQEDCGQMACVERDVDADIERREMRAALLKLTAEQRMVIVLRYIEGCEIDEVAEIMKKPGGAIKALQHRAIAALRRLLTIHSQEEAYETQR
jgi:RNA polymerase sigma-70 factor (ECF subfamily)